MALMQTPTPIITDPRSYMTAVHAAAGVGKTSFAAQIPGHYFFQTEAGTEGVEVYGDPILSWKDFIAKAKEVIDAKRNNFAGQREITMCIVDTLENLFDYAGREVCATQVFLEKGVPRKYDKIDDVPYGKGYKATHHLLLRNLEVLRLNGLGVLLISHTKERPMKWAGQELIHYGLNLPPSAELAVKAACGAIGYFFMEEEIKRNSNGDIVKAELARWMCWQPGFLYTAKHRLENFPEKLPLPMGRGWETYVSAFNETIQKRKGQ